MSSALLQARMLEQTEAWTPWDRRIWHTGTVLTLQELVEATSWASRGVLSDSSVQWLRNSLIPELGRDPGLAVQAVRSQLNGLLKRPLTFASQTRRQLEHIVDFVSENYLEGWQEAAANGPLHLERASRYLSSYMLDLGFHPEYIRKVLKSVSAATEAELVEELRGLAHQSYNTFKGWVLLTHLPEPELMHRHGSWMSPAETAEAMKAIGQLPPRDQAGALRFEVATRDEIAAASLVREQLERLVSRTRFLRSPTRLAYDSKLWLEDGREVKLGFRGPSVSAMSLAKSGLLYEGRLAGDAYGRIDDALELASHLIGSPAPVAVANAWAALESLLIDPGESDQGAGGRVIAADRAARVLTGAWPRAELTRLSYRLTDSAALNPRVRSQLEAVGTDDNVKRCVVLLDSWDLVASTSGLSNKDQAGLRRMDELRIRPREVLGRVESYMTGALRRLYRHRNLVMHGGELRPVALAATTRTTGPLVGALLDRLAVAAHLRREEPLRAIARADVGLQSSKMSGDLRFLLDT